MFSEDIAWMYSFEKAAWKQLDVPFPGMEDIALATDLEVGAYVYIYIYLYL